MQNPSQSTVKEVRLSEVRHRVTLNLGLIIARAWVKQQLASRPTSSLNPKSKLQ